MSAVGIAAHEAGHAIIGALMPGAGIVEKISIVPRGVAIDDFDGDGHRDFITVGERKPIGELELRQLLEASPGRELSFEVEREGESLALTVIPRLEGEKGRIGAIIGMPAVRRQLGVGEALASMLEAKGVPGVVQRCLVRPPASRIGPATEEERGRVIAASPVGRRRSVSASYATSTGSSVSPSPLRSSPPTTLAPRRESGAGPSMIRSGAPSMRSSSRSSTRRPTSHSTVPRRANILMRMGSTV